MALLVGGCGPSPIQPPVPLATVAPFPGNAAADTPLLVDAAWLRRQQTVSPPIDLRLLDLSPLRTYRRGHVPGAVHAWWQDTVDRFYPTYGVVLKERQDPGSRARLLADLGIGDETTVVAYDDDRNRYAAHLVWVLRYFGHDRAAVLDGGLAAWPAEANPERHPTGSTPAAPASVDLQPGYVIGTRELSRRLTDPSIVLVDARTGDEAADDLDGTIRRGRLPGAVSIPWTSTLRDDAGRLKPPAELSRLFRAAGVTPEREVVVYARFGVEASQPWLVLKLLGYPNVRVYDQGWAEWAAKPELPIAPQADDRADARLGRRRAPARFDTVTVRPPPPLCGATQAGRPPTPPAPA